MTQKIVTNMMTKMVLIALVFASVYSVFSTPVFAETTSTSGDVQSAAVNPFCANGVELTPAEFMIALDRHLITATIESTSTPGFAVAHITNDTHCTFPASLSSYRMFDHVLSHQETFAVTGTAQVGPTNTMIIALPPCMAQVDLWFGTAPRTLSESVSYALPSTPGVITWLIPGSTGTSYLDATGTLCVVPTNHAPVITLLGANPSTVTLGTLFADPGATATDEEDGDLTSKIVKTYTETIGDPTTYTITYTVTDSGGLSNRVGREVHVVGQVAPVNQCAITVTSDTTNALATGGFAVATYSNNPFWTASIPGATWIWSSYLVENPVATTTRSFIKTFTIDSTIASSTLYIAADDLYTVTINGNRVISKTTYREGNFRLRTQASYDVKEYLVQGTNTIGIEVINQEYQGAPGTATPQENPAGLLYRLDIFTNKSNAMCGQVNTPPVITLLGANPITVTAGQTYVDPGATATDKEDGDITNKIVVTNPVNTAIPGTYTVTYGVTDSGGMSATATREVRVVTGGGSGNSYCADGKEMTSLELLHALQAGAVTTSIQTDTVSGKATAQITNNTNCTFPTTLSSYKMFDRVLSHQELFDVSPLVHATSTTSITISIPACMAQVDLWYGQAPRVLLDSNPYMFPYNPAVIQFAYVGNTGVGFNDAAGNFCSNSTTNHPPVITLIGANPATVTAGNAFIDPGATATDQEDGDITNKIVKTGAVDIQVPGTYTLTYTVTDSGGLSASTTRQVIVVSGGGGGPSTGKVTFCLVLADQNNTIATTSSNLPLGTFSLNLATSTNFASSTISSKTWNTVSFIPDRRIILASGLDADCMTVDNLPLGTYYYTPLTVNGTLWNTPKYNDQYNQPVNNVFDFFPYSGELFTATTADDVNRNMNADGQIAITSMMPEATVVMYDTYNPAPQCALPQISSSLTASGTVGSAFSYVFTATTTTATTTLPTFTLATTSLPAGLTYDATTHTVSGNPTAAGTYTIALTAGTSCGIDTKNLVITIVSGGGGGGGGTPTADLTVTKTVDKGTANVGDTITYTIRVKNTGPNDATNVKVTDTLPSTLTFVSATSSLGSYATSTGVWTIGNLANNASTTLTIVATINAGTQGQTITNTAVGSSSQVDPNPNDNNPHVDVVVPVPTCTANCGGGGGGGGTPTPPGGGGGNGPIVSNILTIFNEQVVETAPGIAMVSWNTNLPADRRVVYGNSSVATSTQAPNYGYPSSTDLVGTPLLTFHSMVVAIDPGKPYFFRPISSDGKTIALGKELTITRGTGGGGTGGTTGGSCYYLYDYLRRDWNNNPVEVKKLQIFLKELEGFSDLQVTGIYDEPTIAATDAFQLRYKDDVLLPWGYDGTKGTDFTYILTKKKVNEIYCRRAFPVNAQQQAEIDATRAFFESLRTNGIDVNNQPPIDNGTPAQPLPNDVVGVNTGTSTSSSQSTLAGISSTTRNIASRLTANVLEAGKKIGSFLLSFFSWPFNKMGANGNGNNTVSKVVDVVLVLIILVILYLWYKEWKTNKEIEEVNKEIDLQN